MELCPEDELASLVQTMQEEGDGGIAAIERTLALYPGDPRLHFMLGSMLAGLQKPDAAHASLARAVDLAPDFAIARYQLGFFELTSGEVDKALSTWGPLLRLPENAYLRRFVEGMTHLVRDEFEPALAKLREGIGLNVENEPLNGDIRLLITECEKARTGGASAEGSDRSATSVILGQFSHAPSND